MRVGSGSTATHAGSGSTATHAVITGGAGAIGRALASALRRRDPHVRVSLIDRDAAGLRAAAALLGGEVATYTWDLTNVGELPSRLAALVDARGPIDLFANNAGVMEMRSFATMSWALAESLLTIDLVTPLRLMALVAPSMIARRAGTIINVASMAGVVPLRGCVYYGAAKAGLAMASEVAHAELADDGVHVVTVYPGPVKSGLEARARAQMPATWLARSLPTGDPETLAEAIAVAVEKKRPRVVYPTFYDLASRLSPLAARFTARFSPRPLDPKQ